MTAPHAVRPRPSSGLPGDREVQVVSADQPFPAEEVSVARAVGELLQVVRESLDLEVVFVGQITGGRRHFRHVSSAMSPAPIEVGGSHALEDTLCQRILDGRLPALIPSVRAVVRQHGLPDALQALGTHVGVPVHLPDGRLYGMLCGFNLRESAAPLDARDVKRLEVAAGAAARLLAQADGSATGADVELA
ncbi:GAF domain-containing protein [Xenophilus sp. Marseille-Q4582]|uniref:GAF domain-containing protein n=1 Tax=Xenophilus sp. Marseille-Q4582 TaxID=2866600 RepID=UPI001CE3E63B|nr:GAF domain-containing protein [Xenophilus sp. Marseille-Q4582]